MTKKQEQITWDEFEERFKPVQNTVSNREEFNGWLFETYGEDERHIAQVAQETPNKVWTVLDVGEDDLIIVNGWHFVNRFGYFITEVEFDDSIDYTVKDEE